MRPPRDGGLADPPRGEPPHPHVRPMAGSGPIARTSSSMARSTSPPRALMHRTRSRGASLAWPGGVCLSAMLACYGQRTPAPDFDVLVVKSAVEYARSLSGEPLRVSSRPITSPADPFEAAFDTSSQGTSQLAARRLRAIASLGVDQIDDPFPRRCAGNLNPQPAVSADRSGCPAVPEVRIGLGTARDTIRGSDRLRLVRVRIAHLHSEGSWTTVADLAWRLGDGDTIEPAPAIYLATVE